MTVRCIAACRDSDARSTIATTVCAPCPYVRQFFHRTQATSNRRSSASWHPFSPCRCSSMLQHCTSRPEANADKVPRTNRHLQAVWRRKAAAAKAGRLVRQARNLKELFSDLSGRQGGLRAEVPCLTLCLTLSPTLAQHPIAKPCLEASVSLSVSHGTLISFSVARWDPCSVFFFRRFRHLEFARSFGGSRFLEQRRRPPNRGHSWPSACCARWSVQLCDRTGAASKTCALSCQLQFSAPWARSKTKGWIWVRRPTVLNTCPDEMMDAVLRFYHSPKPKQLMPLTNMLQKHLWLWCSAAFAC